MLHPKQDRIHHHVTKEQWKQNIEITNAFSEKTYDNLTDVTCALEKAAIRKKESASLTIICWAVRHRAQLWVGKEHDQRDCGLEKEKDTPKLKQYTIWEGLGWTWPPGFGGACDWDSRASVTKKPSASPSFNSAASCRVLAFVGPTCPHSGTHSQVSCPPLSQTLVFSGNLTVPATSTRVCFLGWARGLPRRAKDQWSFHRTSEILTNVQAFEVWRHFLIL